VTTADTAVAVPGAGEPLARARQRWVELSWTRALLAVTTAERAAAEGPLGGLTFTVKDTFAAAGLPSTGGSLLLAGHVPDRDATLIARLKAAGAALFAKANCAEFGNGIDTETRIGGRVLHPTDPAVSPGGSSGGDAVAVAGGIVDFAIGGDYGGSVRWPAQCTGVYGLRTLVGDDIGLLCPGTRAVLEGPPGRGWGHPEVREAWRYSREITARVSAVLAGVDALLVPVAAVSAVAHGGGAEIGGRFITGPDLMAQCRAVSLTGLPSLAMPAMATDGGRTGGVQVVGPPGGDAQCCAVAAEIAAQLRW
jgi:Asp-tRNA(Asn)/Glu-tRNA(Gln) amidotransferase A subunit family amidase